MSDHRGKSHEYAENLLQYGCPFYAVQVTSAHIALQYCYYRYVPLRTALMHTRQKHIRARVSIELGSDIQWHEFHANDAMMCGIVAT